MLAYAFTQPLATLSLGNSTASANDEIYITKECISVSVAQVSQDQCGEIDPVWKPYMQAIMAIVIALMVCIVLELLGMKFNATMCYVAGLLVLGLAIALIVLVAKMSSFHSGSNYYKLTNTSIGVIVAAGLLVLLELCCNPLVHRIVLAPVHLISGKKI
jgi:hypothetical protein